MDKMPKEIKLKLRELSKIALKLRAIEGEVCHMIEEYGVDIERLTACSNCSPQTEGLAYITNAECGDKTSLENSIELIEKVFLHIVNNESK